MTRKCWAVVTFGLGVALAPLVHQLGTACLHPAAAVAQEQLEPHVLLPAIDNKTPTVIPVGIPKGAADGKRDVFSLGLGPDDFNKRIGGNGNGPTPQKNSLPQRGDELIRVTETATSSAEEFLELSKQKAELLTPEEMAHEVDSLRKELTELRATVQLREAVGKLKQLIGEHPQSQAAQRATRMLEAEIAPNSRKNSSPSDVGLDPFFSSPGQSKSKPERKI